MMALQHRACLESEEEEWWMARSNCVLPTSTEKSGEKNSDASGDGGVRRKKEATLQW